ncbi:CDP-diacylglycerol diphosphatase [Gallaecimonas mangrovi]|uniref:CDP-diacylglycerol diphosphatase n=1 Tax=Gallaecimonas mangrovi TaxID=2291597 RepID=UPI000E2000E9|nr:CDP-diacylglycerol diphosphatase [Gallaecimonas mangrovi]
MSARQVFAFLIFIPVLLVTGCASKPHHNPDALWQLISQRCVPGYLQKQDPAPCQSVDLKQGYVTLKDRRGPLQYLLMPTDKITGMESPALLNSNTPHFFNLAWHQRQLLTQKRGQKVADADIGLAINSQHGRTQNQLHVHISCLRVDVRQQLNALSAGLSQQWRSETLVGHHYLMRTLSGQQLATESVFRRFAKEVPKAGGHLGDFGMALATLPSGELVLMASQDAGGSAEEIQDHSCAILNDAALAGTH